jgi:hypothetical protein
LFGEDALTEALAGTHGLDAAATISRLSQILALHTRDWASDDTALLARHTCRSSSRRATALMSTRRVREHGGEISRFREFAP